MKTMEISPLERAARVLEQQVDLRLAHMTGREIVDDRTIIPALARAVLLAIREPSVEMGMAGARHRIEGGAGDVWRAMIDAALAE